MKTTIILFIAAGVALCQPAPAAAQLANPRLSGISFMPSARPTTARAPQGDLTVQDWIKRPEMLGDWGGLRPKMRERGLTVEAHWTQFFQSAPTSQDARGWDYGGRLDFKARQDFTNMGFEGLTGNAHVIFRYGDTPLFGGGTLMPTNAALLFPENEGAHARISAFNITKTLGPNALIEAGRFDMVERYVKPFSGGEGLDKFTNLAFVFPPLTGRTTPPIAEGVFFTALRNAAPLVTVGLYESTEEGFFKNGATFLASVNIPLKLFETPGHYVVTTTISSTEATSLDQTPYALIPAFNVPLATESNAWTFDFTFDQYLWWDPATKTGIGLFGMIGASDSNPSTFDIFGHVGVQGNSLIPTRLQDTFGAAYYFGGVSNTLQETLLPLIRLRDENGFEAYYDFAVTGWSKVSAHFQFIDPFAVGSKTRGFFTIRWKLTF